ncbi:DUF6879 family protein [Nocardia sp. CDC153]
MVAAIDDDEFERLLTVFEREALHLEMRDAYGTAVEKHRWPDGRCG